MFRKGNVKCGIGLLALAMTTTWAGCWESGCKDTPESNTWFRICEARNAVEIFHMKMGRYPSAEKGLQELLTPPDDEKEAANWVQLFEKIPVDAWGTELQYESIDDADGPTFRVFSAGPDKIPGTKDDIPAK